MTTPPPQQLQVPANLQITITLEAQQWQNGVIGALAKEAWYISNPLILAIQEQMQVAAQQALQPPPLDNGHDRPPPRELPAAS